MTKLIFNVCIKPKDNGSGVSGNDTSSSEYDLEMINGKISYDDSSETNSYDAEYYSCSYNYKNNKNGEIYHDESGYDVSSSEYDEERINGKIYYDDDSSQTNSYNAEYFSCSSNESEDYYSTTYCDNVDSTKTDDVESSAATEKSDKEEKPPTIHYYFPADLAFFWELSDSDIEKSHCSWSCIFVSQFQCCFGELCSFGRKQNLKSYFTSITFFITLFDVIAYLVMVYLNPDKNPLKIDRENLMKYGALSWEVREWAPFFTLLNLFQHKNIVDLVIDIILLNNIGPINEKMISKFIFLLYIYCVQWSSAFFSLFPFDIIVCGNKNIIFSLFGLYLYNTKINWHYLNDLEKKELFKGWLYHLPILLFIMVIAKFGAIPCIISFLIGFFSPLTHILFWYIIYTCCLIFSVIIVVDYYVPFM